MDALTTLVIYAASGFGLIAYLILTRREGLIQGKFLWAKIRKKSLKKIVFIGQDKTMKTKYEFPDVTKNSFSVDHQDYTLNQESMIHDIDRNMQAVVIVGGGAGVVNPLGAQTIRCPHCQQPLKVPHMTSRLDPQWIATAIETAKMIGMRLMARDMSRERTLLYIAAGGAVIAVIMLIMVINNQSAMIATLNAIKSAVLQMIQPAAPAGVVI